MTSPPAPKEPAIARPDRDIAIAHAVNLTDLVNGEPGSMAFYRTTFANHPSQFVTYHDLRKQGDMLDKATLKALGLRANTKLSSQFFATLNEKGRADPVGAAGVIGLAVSTALSASRALAAMEALGVDEAKFLASNMAAGPCAAAAGLDGQTIALADAPMLPFATCTHPDQCSCCYQAKLSILNERISTE
ncbi:hypothetical protein [Blastomonas fulva]|uniref:hypothetical protein n=1 Tax=Blastomonas fulva TaxID=1550728 RepID=UPI0013C2F0D9|nr:hypothetical protein [Blastomonas fulva]